MATYILAYHMGETPENPKSQEEGAKSMAKWQEWIESLGDAVVNPGTPLGESRTVSSGSVSKNSNPGRLTGFAMVKAENLDAAIEIAKGDPFLEMGTVEVAEVFDMQ